MESPPHEAEHCIVGVEGGGGETERDTQREKTLDVISKNVKICQTQIPLKGFIN